MDKGTLHDLIQQAAKGDMDAFANAFESLRPGLTVAASRIVGPDDAQDVVMETYLKAWKALPNFNQRSSLKTWLYRIVRNCAIDYTRKRKRSKSWWPRNPSDGICAFPDGPPRMRREPMQNEWFARPRAR